VSAAKAALTRTTNIGAWDDQRLVGAVRVLTDGYFFATVFVASSAAERSGSSAGA